MTITFEQFHTCDACGCDLEDKDECICQVCKDKNLVAKVKAAILAKIAVSDGVPGAYTLGCECMRKVPGINPSNVDDKVELAIAALAKEGLIEGKETTGIIEELRSYTGYELTNVYYTSEHNPYYKK